MLDEETVEYGVCLILAGMLDRTLPPGWNDDFRRSKEPLIVFPYDGTLWIKGRAWHPWLSLR